MLIPTRVVYLKADGRRAVIAEADFSSALHDERQPGEKKAPAGGPDQTPPAPAPPATSAAAIATGNAAAAGELIHQAKSASELDALEAAENGREQGPRQGVLKAIAKRRQELEK